MTKPSIAWSTPNPYLNYHGVLHIYFEYHPAEAPETGPEAHYPGCLEYIDILRIEPTGQTSDLLTTEDLQAVYNSDHTIELIKEAIERETEEP